jgi:FkbM family methyltransferase
VLPRFLFNRSQHLILAAYRIIVGSGLLSHQGGRATLAWLYLAYKRWFEATNVEALHEFVRLGSTVVDVGANIGFFTIHFARWAGRNGCVVAIEPELQNLKTLRRRLSREQGSARIELNEGAAAEMDAPVFLIVNPAHPGDHRLGAGGVAINGYAIDNLLTARGLADVSLIKIDVQGAEFRALKGAEKTLRSAQPTLFIEIDDAALAEAGSSADEISDYLTALGYQPFAYDQTWKPITSLRDDSERRKQRGYADYLFRPRKQP